MKVGFLFLLLSAQVVSAQIPYKVGYRCLFLTDSGRVYKPASRPGEALHFRPLEVDVWYPGVRGGASGVRGGASEGGGGEAPTRFGEYIGLLEQRADRFQDDTVYKGLTSNMVHYLCANLQIADSSRLLDLRTASYRNIAPTGGRFPLLIYFCSYNGICFENVPLFEALAAHGYVVASITSVGRYPGNMTLKPDDLFEQVKDGLFAMDVLKRETHTDAGMVGLIGYSWGGPAALVAAMNSDAVGAILSLDGSELHYYGDAKDEDGDFDEIRRSAFFHINGVRVPYGYLESGGKQNDRPVDSIFDILPAVSAPKLYRRFNGATHEDFSCLPGLAARLRQGKSEAPVLPTDSFACYFFDRFLRKKVAARNDPIWMMGADSSYPVVNPSLAKTIVIEGRVFDEKDKTPLAYVNVGIPGKNTGTVSQPDGRYRLKIGEDQGGDTLVFSMAGYVARAVAIAGLRARPASGMIYLNERVTELNTVVLTTRKPRIRRLGNGSRSALMSAGFPLRLRGAEMGIRVDLGKTPVKLRRFNFYLTDSHVDSAVFRLNIHRIKNGRPGDNILQENILVPIGKKRGLYSIDLTSYAIVTEGELLVALEWLGDIPETGESGAVYFSAGFLGAATWRRETSFGNWKKASGIGIGFNLDVQK